MRVTCMLGVTASSDQKSRALGSAANRSESKVIVVFVEVTSTTGDAPLTVTVSARLAIFSATLIVAVNPRPTRMPSRTRVSKPPNS